MLAAALSTDAVSELCMNSRHITTGAAVCCAAFGMVADRHAQAQWVEPDAISLRTVDSFEPGDLFGWLVLPLGDVNNDGVPDFASGAPFNDAGGGSSGGRLSVHSGANGAELWFDFTGLTSAIMGYTLEAYRDVDGDGARDFLAAAPFNGASGGIVRLYSGRTGAVLKQFIGPVNSNFGASISASGDFSGDGVNDIAIGAPGDDTLTQNGGRVYVYSGVSTGRNAWALIRAIDPPEAGLGSFGDAVEFLDDIGGQPNNREELAAGIRLSGSTAPGKIYALSNNQGGVTVLYTIENISLSGALDSDRLTGGRDVNGDGFNDLLLGQLNLSTAILFSGVNGSILRTLTGDASTAFGSGSLIPDITGDGVPDVAIGARLHDAGANNGGRAYLYSGATGALIRTMTCVSDSRSFGADIDAIGDINGDGGIDFVVGGSGSSLGGPGRVEIMKGIPLPCPADLNDSGGVNTDDLIALVGAWGPCPGACPPSCLADIAPAGGNCQVNTDDLIALITSWGQCP